MTNVPVTWKKSSFSGDTDCVEVSSDRAKVRNSKKPEVTLSVGVAAVDRLVRWVKTGRAG